MLDHGAECPLGIGTAGDAIFRGRRAQGSLRWLKKASWRSSTLSRALKDGGVWTGRRKRKERHHWKGPSGTKVKVIHYSFICPSNACAPVPMGALDRAVS